MIDHLLGRPSVSWKRTQVAFVLLFWGWTLRSGNPRGPAGLRRYNDLLKKFTPWQLTVALFACLYGIRHWDILFGLAAPEPLARLYSRGFYRATWINTALDAGFATASAIPFKCLRDIASVIFSVYYLVYANEADEKLRKFRAVPTVEVLRVTWEKTTNPIIQFITRLNRPSISLKRKYVFPRPPGSKYTKPITCWLYFSRSDIDLIHTKNLILDIPGGGFIAMSPLHHEERLLRWAIKTGLPILSIDYCKAPEYPFPYAIHECMDVYRLIHESNGRMIGMGRNAVDVVLTGDSAGANLSAAMITCLLESPPTSPFHELPLPVGIIWMYPALDFNFTSWMSPENLRILNRDQSSADLPEGILEAKNHLKHRSPLSVVDDRAKSDGLPRRHHRRTPSNISQSLANLPGMVATTLKRAMTPMTEKQQVDVELRAGNHDGTQSDSDGTETASQDSRPKSEPSPRSMITKSLSERVLFHEDDDPDLLVSINGKVGGSMLFDKNLVDEAEQGQEPKKVKIEKKSFGTRLTMTSRTGYFNDRIISPSMMRCMAICYIGPRNAPDLTKDYHISPIFTPLHLLAKFPPVYLVCGEKDPFVDDTVIIAGKLREAKQMRRRQALIQSHMLKDPSSRMNSRTAIDPIIDESEADWVQMRIFEGWSHGFGQMLSLLPEASTALDLTAEFILSAFQKRADKSQQPSEPHSNRNLPLEFTTPAISGADDDEEPLTFTPTKKSRTISSGSFTDPSSPKIRTVTRTVSPRKPSGPNGISPPAPRLTRRLSSFASEASQTTHKRPIPDQPVTPMVEFNAATAGAIVTPPIIVHVPVDAPPTRKEVNILEDHHDILDRRREEAGYGILATTTTADDHSKPLTELAAPDLDKVEKPKGNEPRPQYVDENALLERRRIDSAYGITNDHHDMHDDDHVHH